jgi:hypothetical protein
MHFALALALSLLLQKAGIAVAPSPHQPEQKRNVAPFTSMPEAPRLPRVDQNACPFEGCQFGKWTANTRVVVYSTWETTRRPIASLSKEDEVTAITGVNVVLQPGNGIFDRDVILYRAKKGDVVYSYRDCGEGAVDIWVHGRFIQCAEPQFSWKPGYGCQANSDGRWLSLGKSEWWAQIRLKDDSVGWVLVEGNFDTLHRHAGLVSTDIDRSLGRQSMRRH